MSSVAAALRKELRVHNSLADRSALLMHYPRHVAASVHMRAGRDKEHSIWQNCFFVGRTVFFPGSRIVHKSPVQLLQQWLN